MADKVSRRAFLQVAASGAVVAGVDAHFGPAFAQTSAKAAAAAWSMNATIIEACTCNMFCPCYFSTVPSGHSHGAMTEHYCRFNMGYRVNRGNFKGVNLAGMKFWAAGDLGADFSKGAEWAEVTFEPAATKAQRDAIAAILPHSYPVTWKAFTIGQDAAIEWSATNDRAVARLNGGKAAEVILNHAPTGMSAKEPVVIRNLKYFGVPRNTGFILMPNEVNAYRVGAKPFESKGTNGFMITYDINANDVKTKA
jgi:Protein of unknown function (DUF1326)